MNMSFQSKITSYATIIDYLNIHGRATAQDIRDRLKQRELASSPATFERLKSELLQAHL